MLFRSISNETLLILEYSHPSIHDVYKWGQYNQAHIFLCVNMQIGKVVLVNIPTHPSRLLISTLFIIGKNNFIEMRLLHGKDTK